MYPFDTIAAIATPPGEGSVGVVRVSGPQAPTIATRIFQPRGRLSPEEFKSHRLYYGHIIDPASNTPVDDGFLTVMKKPRSYTGEDVVEISCHGGQLILQRVIEVILREGARLAEPGEFTKRAFLNGRMDLAQAEAVIDLIRAKTDLGLKASRAQLEGGLSRKVDEIKDSLADLLARIEAELDFPEDDVERLGVEEMERVVEEAKRGISQLLDTYTGGRILKEGIKVIILGRPNVGKSTLLNILLKEERAIVTPIPGTTRDIIEDVVNIKGIPVRLMDTAGLRETADEVESIGIRLAMKRLEEAQMAIYVADATAQSHGKDIETLKGIPEDKKLIVAVNKIDLMDSSKIEGVRGAFKDRRVVEISALYEKGIDSLEDAIYEGAVGQPSLMEGEVLVTNLRHKMALVGAGEALERARDAFVLSMEFLAIELRETTKRLGEITGEVTTEDILDRIFSQFCIGK
ncbi:MAG: tRNA uridine-5-carboxymethylaminomethyl(34) synthesis GTPase MnmE [Deltaproteobacteria bacterium]|nr:tRNA uridine-5-carboxymethylaminomethyl(34) synthesis GTPase MnmE [Deltaproteobacteria bacterium]